jgi:hypothetical protein
MASSYQIVWLFKLKSVLVAVIRHRGIGTPRLRAEVNECQSKEEERNQKRKSPVPFE